MDFSQLSLSRESTRSYSKKPVSREQIESIIDDAMCSPSACNSQPWKFVVCDGETATKMPSAIIGQVKNINHWTNQVPAFIVVCETPARLISALSHIDQQTFAQMDIGIAAANVCNSAADKGLGTCIIGCFNEPTIKELLCIPDEIKIKLIITLGHPNTPTRQKIRKNKDDIRSYNKW